MEIFLYLGLCIVVTLLVLGASGLFPARPGSPDKYMPYESGIRTHAELLQKRFPLHHYLVALIFLVFDVEVIFLFPWAVVAQDLGGFAFYEMLFFLVVLLAGFAYVWRKGGLKWD